MTSKSKDGGRYSNGGKTTLKKHGVGHYSKIAKKRWKLEKAAKKSK